MRQGCYCCTAKVEAEAPLRSLHLPGMKVGDETRGQPRTISLHHGSPTRAPTAPPFTSDPLPRTPAFAASIFHHMQASVVAPDSTLCTLTTSFVGHRHFHHRGQTGTPHTIRISSATSVSGSISQQMLRLVKLLPNNTRPDLSPAFA